MFGVARVEIGALTTVADLVGFTSHIAGFVVHIVITFIVGSSYGLLFRRQSHDIGSVPGWGASYGFIWWNIGPLTFMPAFLGTTPIWSAETAASVFPNLVGHLAYGAGVGVTFHLLESRYSQWLVPRRQADVKRLEHRTSSRCLPPRPLSGRSRS